MCAQTRYHNQNTHHVAARPLATSPANSRGCREAQNLAGLLKLCTHIASCVRLGTTCAPRTGAPAERPHGLVCAVCGESSRTRPAVRGRAFVRVGGPPGERVRQASSHLHGARRTGAGAWLGVPTCDRRAAQPRAGRGALPAGVRAWGAWRGARDLKALSCATSLNCLPGAPLRSRDALRGGEVGMRSLHKGEGGRPPRRRHGKGARGCHSCAPCPPHLLSRAFARKHTPPAPRRAPSTQFTPQRCPGCFGACWHVPWTRRAPRSEAPARACSCA